VNPFPRTIRRISGAVLADGSRVEVVIDDDGWVTRVDEDSGRPASGADELDLTGHVLLTAPADPHAHLDKALSWDAIRPPMGDLVLAIRSWREHAATMTVDEIAGRARRQALAMLANGTTAVRSHLDVLLGAEPTRSAEALVRVRDELAGLMDLELVALAGVESPTADVEAVLDLGVDLVGGAPHLAPDPLADLGRLLDLAERRGVGVDLHTDEGLDGAITLDALAARVRDWSVNVSAGHCVRLSTLPAADLDHLVAAAVDARIGIIANPITNLYLQGWDDGARAEPGVRRGIAPARALLDAGARFAAGADNVRDPFNPLGRGDALETAMLLVTAAHLTIDEAYAAVSTGAREVMGLPPAGPVVGARADLLAIRATGLEDAVATAPADRVVLHAGRLVARSRTVREIAEPGIRPAAAASATSSPATPAPAHAEPLTPAPAATAAAAPAHV